MHSEPVVLGACASELSLNGPNKASTCAHSNVSGPGERRHRQYPTEGATASPWWVIRQPR
jgi:hypothetical protein